MQRVRITDLKKRLDRATYCLRLAITEARSFCLGAILEDLILKLSGKIFRIKVMGKQGTECVAYGCNKRKRNTKDSNYVRSDSEGSDDEETSKKRTLPRTFHR